MHAYDELRESIIKQSRDVQKLSKQAIFSLHRGNHEEAGKRLDQAATAAQHILPLIEREPTLRGGSFSSAMEEVRLRCSLGVELRALTLACSVRGSQNL